MEEPLREEAPRAESVFGVLGTAVMLSVLAVGVAIVGGVMFGFQARPVDAVELAEDLFREGPPYGLELEEATKLPTGQTLLRYGAAEGSEGGTTPEELLLILFRNRGEARAAFDAGSTTDDAQSIGRRVVEWEEDPDEAWHATLVRKEISWSRWRADLRIERAFLEEGEWRDSTRLDLGQPERHLVVFAQYPRGVAGTEEGALDLVRRIRMR